jgi:uncharacterized membrane protein YeiB
MGAPEKQRITGYDLARGFAVLGMVILNFKGIFSCPDSFPVELCRTLDFMNRRAAAVLVMTAGAGLTLLSGYTLQNGRVRITAGTRMVLARRACFLLVAGTLLSMTWSGDILHFYGAYILIGICFLTGSSKTLAAGGALFWAGSFIRFSDCFDWIIQAGEAPVFSGRLVDLCFTGYYPIFPWAAFLITGMWLGRQAVEHPDFRKKAMISGSILVLSAEVVARAGPALAEGNPFLTPLALVTGVDLPASTPLGVVSGIGTGLWVVMLSLAAARNPGRKWIIPMCLAGRTSLSLYVFQIVLVINGLLFLGVSDQQNVLVVVAGSLAFFWVYTRLAAEWLRHHDKGPLETLMRRFPVFHPRHRLETGIKNSGAVLNRNPWV